MDIHKYSTDLQWLRDRVRGQRLLIGALSVSLFVALLIIYQIAGTQRVVVLPPNVSKHFWVSGDRGDVSYLSQMGGYVAWLHLDLTPKSVDWKKEALLAIAAPEEYGELKKRLEVEADRIKRLNLSTYFELQQTVASEDEQSVVTTGLFVTMVNGQITSRIPKSYRAAFSVRGGPTPLTSLKEVRYDSQGMPTMLGAATLR